MNHDGLDAEGLPKLSVVHPGSQGALRHRNRERVLEVLATRGARTQVDLARATGLSEATVSNLVRVLVGERVVVTTPTTRSGRRAVSVRLNSRGAVVAGLDVGRAHVRVALVTLATESVGHAATPLPPGHGAEEAVDVAEDLLASLLAVHGLERDQVVGAGVGLPGPVDAVTGRVADASVLAAWAGVDIPAELGARLGVPVHVDNDANLGALAEATWGRAGVDDLVFVKLGSGIGTGLVLRGELFHGHLGLAGEIGHVPTGRRGPRCQVCGRSGCLESLASVTAVLARLARADPPRRLGDARDVVAAVTAGDPAVLSAVRAAAGALGGALATVTDLLAPQVVVIGGPLACLGEVLLTPVRRALAATALPSVAAGVRVEVSRLGEAAEALGAGALAVRHAGLVTVTTASRGVFTA